MPSGKDPLTDADRARIRAEEVERAKVRAELEAETRAGQPFNPAAATAHIGADHRVGGGGLGCFGWVVVAVLGIIGFFVYTAVTNSAGSASGANSGAMDVGTFGIKCQHAISDQLKAPATAQLQNFFIDQTQGRLTGDGASGWHWATYVDSQNSFGANIRTNFVCSTDPNGTEVRASLDGQ
jgi:hypothetical protein